jgi:hypothetical protein
MERGNTTGAWYWKCLPTRTLAFKGQMSVPGHKSSKGHLVVLCCGNAFRNYKLKLVVIEKAKNHNCSRLLKQSLFPSFITTRKEHEWLRRFFKIGSTSMLLQKFRLP